MRDWHSLGRYILNPVGKYSINSIYIALIGRKQMMEIADLVRFAVAQPKHRFIGWLASLGTLMTNDRIIGMQIQVENVNCILCNKDALESQDHLFATCGWITAVRCELNIWTGHDVQYIGVKQLLEQFKRKQ